MPDLIRLLPDAIVNQIAAGEVIQRPASVVKELMDNAIDAGATQITLIIRDAGKTLIQINDNGLGMSPIDARMAFERHATSKIRSAEDLFKIQTKGFRGEALASIASVAEVEIKTKPHPDELGTKITIADSTVKSQDACVCPSGTQISVQHLFYNVPARRKFLKADTVELRHIHDEFLHQALSFPEIHFIYFNNDNELYNLYSASLKQRIVSIYGKKYNEEILPVEQDMDIFQLSGFIGKPELAKKSRGEQLLFVNRRFIRSPYLQHAVHGAFDEIIAPDQFPFYILFLQIDPDRIDVNVHPTKQEIKFEDERLIYNFLKVSIRHILGKFTLAPRLDFENAAPGIEQLFSNSYSGSKGNTPFGSASNPSYDNSIQKVRWEQLNISASGNSDPQDWPAAFEASKTSSEVNTSKLFPDTHTLYCFQVHKSYIIVQTVSGIIIIDQQHAHERILYEYFKTSINRNEPQVLKLLFPQNLHLPGKDALIIKTILSSLNKIGFEIEEFGSDSFIVHGTPAMLEGKYNELDLLNQILDKYKINEEFELPIEENLARSAAISSSVKRSKLLNQEEMQLLVQNLFECEMPYTSPTGKKCYISISLDELNHKLT
ncbi:MAG: DNA mismatch repair endonuclease MutL [Bacteroidota bacterium]|nr:DNA mismatch repair endonuclease MutL [Bacteroidota bacterium]